MKNIKELIDNPYFFKWVFCTNDEHNSYWKQYMRENQEQVKLIMETKSKISNLRFKNDTLSFNEQVELVSLIRQTLDREERKIKRMNVFKSFMKYAAVAILFSVVSSIVVWFQMKGT